MSANIEQLALSRPAWSDLVRMVGVGLKACAGKLERRRRPKTLQGLSPWLLIDMGLQPGPVARIPGDGGVEHAADAEAETGKHPPTNRIIMGYGIPANDNLSIFRPAFRAA